MTKKEQVLEEMILLMAQSIVWLIAGKSGKLNTEKKVIAHFKSLAQRKVG